MHCFLKDTIICNKSCEVMVYQKCNSFPYMSLRKNTIFYFCLGGESGARDKCGANAKKLRN